MKTAIIILGNQWVCPYVNTYKHILEKSGSPYDVILWDRDGSDFAAPVRYSSGNADLANPVVKTWHYLKYAHFIKKSVLVNGYDRLVVSGPHLAILLARFLRKRFKGRYIVDYRDISIEQKPLLKSVYSKVLADSYCNVISSPGFREYLSKEYDFLISHNFAIDAAVDSLGTENPVWRLSSPLEVLTIGYIRNYSSNVKIIQSLGSNGSYSLRFVGRGDAAGALQGYAVSNGHTNVEFSGFYKKNDEATLVDSCNFINIFFPDDVEHSPIMSNRFYLALIHKKPVIVTEGSVQAALVKEYGLGVVTKECIGLDEDIRQYLSTFDYAMFCRKCNELLALFVEDYRALERSVAEFVRL